MSTGRIGWHNDATRYGRVSIAFHWIVVALVVIQWLLGEAMTDWFESDKELSFALFQYHKSVGFLILFVVLARLVWRLREPVPAPPPDQPRWQTRLAVIVHWGLYLLLLGLPISGWLTVSTSKYKDLPIRFFGLFEIPKLMGPDKKLHDIFGEVHEVMVTLLLILLALHVAGALYHHFVRRDDVLKRMLGRA
ncbi:MAG: cytochrome b [Alphaproteobacteria bacterium]|nr:MAG: cytochrome b [Alphaproteobacteria bacterium]